MAHKRLNRSPEEENIFPESKRIKHAGLTDEFDALFLCKEEAGANSGCALERTPLGDANNNDPRRRMDRSGSYVVGSGNTLKGSPLFDLSPPESGTEVVFKTPDMNVHSSPCPPTTLNFGSPGGVDRGPGAERQPTSQTTPLSRVGAELSSTGTSGYVSANESSDDSAERDSRGEFECSIYDENAERTTDSPNPGARPLMLNPGMDVCEDAVSCGQRSPSLSGSAMEVSFHNGPKVGTTPCPMEVSHQVSIRVRFHVIQLYMHCVTSSKDDKTPYF